MLEFGIIILGSVTLSWNKKQNSTFLRELNGGGLIAC